MKAPQMTLEERTAFLRRLGGPARTDYWKGASSFS